MPWQKLKEEEEEKEHTQKGLRCAMVVVAVWWWANERTNALYIEWLGRKLPRERKHIYTCIWTHPLRCLFFHFERTYIYIYLYLTLDNNNHIPFFGIQSCIYDILDCYYHTLCEYFCHHAWASHQCHHQLQQSNTHTHTRSLPSIKWTIIRNIIQHSIIYNIYVVGWHIREITQALTTHICQTLHMKSKQESVFKHKYLYYVSFIWMIDIEFLLTRQRI